MYIAIKLLTGLCAFAFCFAAAELKITSPKDETVVHPGDAVEVVVSAAANEFSVIGISAYSPIPDSDNRTSPPYRFTIHVPRNITPGLYTLTAVGAATKGEGGSEDSVRIDVEEPDDPVRIWLSLSDSLNLKVGGSAGVTVVGDFPDGHRRFLDKSKRTKYRSADLHIITVTDDGFVKAVGEGSTELRISIGDKRIVMPVVVTKPVEK
ncbi:MAG TPA: hypothetical protein VGL97_10960 [Bryobacteraceae bacterium]|jgi:hypothetical protein